MDYNRNPDIDALTLSRNAAGDVLQGLETAVKQMREARQTAQSYSRPLAFVAGGLHRISDPAIKDRLWKSYVKIQLGDPDLETTLDNLKTLVSQITSALSDAHGKQEWVDWKAQGRPRFR